MLTVVRTMYVPYVNSEVEGIILLDPSLEPLFNSQLSEAVNLNRVVK